MTLDVDAAWLSGVLVASGALDGEVADVEVEAVGGTWSRMARLRPRYAASASGERPASLLLKVCEDGVFGASEVHYYTRDYVGLDAPQPRCFHAAMTGRGYRLLLEDLTPTHTSLWDVPPSLALGEAIADAVARLHAARWGPDRLAAIGAAMPGDAEVARYLTHVRGGLAPLFDGVGDAMPGAWRDALLAMAAHHEGAMRERARRPDGLVLLHGDVNPGNVLAPRDGSLAPLYLIDRQPFDWSLTVWIGAWDLAYPMVLFWEPAQRREWQEAVLRRYRDRLAAAGIELAWPALWRDYQLAVVQCLEHAVEWLVVPEDRVAKRWLWEMQLGRAMDAYLELGCDRLWTA